MMPVLMDRVYDVVHSDVEWRSAERMGRLGSRERSYENIAKSGMRFTSRQGITHNGSDAGVCDAVVYA
jgi:hypothetical protein